MSLQPKVSFVVPCYNLAHLLPECIESILTQTFSDFEILIMDDCSPDDTAAVAQSYSDPRVKHIRNNPNLGHLRNYNKGIDLAQGEYVWLISADDRLRRPYALEKYVQTLENNPQVGYVFSPGMGLQDGHETRVIHSHGCQDALFEGKKFLMGLLNANSVVAASGMARKECYERVSYFPTDMPWGGDWYLWCVFALHFEVAYIAEPMVHYRTHGLSMTTYLTTTVPTACTHDDLILPWRVKQKARELGVAAVVARCRHMIAYESARSIIAHETERAAGSLPLADCESLITRQADSPFEANWILSRLYICLGDRYFWLGETDQASQYFLRGLRRNWRQPSTWIKYSFARFGRFGLRLRQREKSLRGSMRAKTPLVGRS